MSGKVGALVAAAAVMVAAVVGYLVVVAPDDGGQTAAPRQSQPSPAASPVHPAPSGGTVTQTVTRGAAGPTVTARISRPARLADGVRIKVLSTKTTTVKPNGPRELAGLGLVVRLEIDNGSQGPVDVGGAIVTVLHGKNQVAPPSASDPSDPFQGTLRRGESGRGTYVFRVPRDSTTPRSIVVQYGAGRGVVRFVR